MRVLIAIHGFPPTYYGGAERAGERIAHWLAKNGHHVEVFTIERLDASEQKLETRIENQVIVHRLFLDMKSKPFSFKDTYENPEIAIAFQKLLKDGVFDIVHLVSGYLLGGQIIDLTRKIGIPVVVTLTEYWFMCSRLNLLRVDDELCIGPESDDKCARCLMEDKRRYRLLDYYASSLLDTFWSLARYTSFNQIKVAEVNTRRIHLKRALESADLVICPSQFITNKFTEFGYQTASFVHIQHGVERPTTTSPASGTKTRLKLGYMGQIKSHKGIDLIIQAVINLLDAQYSVSLDIWGDANTTSAFITKLLKQTLSYPDIHWNGRYQRNDLGQVLSGFDLLVVPSRWYENNPTVILEAFQAGMPVIASRLGGMAELIEHNKNGLLFELNDVADLVRQVKRVLDEPSLLSQLRSGIPTIKSGDEEVQEIFEHYVRLLQPNKKRGEPVNNIG